LVCLYYSASAQVPQTLTYQGFLTESDIPVTTPRDITLTLLHGPAVKHTETFTSQTVDKGLFTVTLGKVPGNALPGDFDTWKNELTVEIKVNNVVIGNPVPLTTVPYSFMASHVDNVHVQDLADGSLTGTKVSPNFGSQNISTTGTVTATSFSGSGASLTSLSVSSLEIDDGAIVNADINAGAAIADTKLATISTAGKVSGNAITSGTIGGNTAINTSGSITAASFTGSGAGLTSLAPANLSSAVAVDKGGTGATTLTGVLFGNGTAAVSGLSSSAANQYLRRNAGNTAYEFGALSIVNADINGSAGIVDSKLATISTAGKVSGSAITSGTIGGSSSINTSGSLVSTNYVAATSGVHVGNTTAPAAGNLEVDGYSKFGSSAPSIKMLKFTGTTSASASGTTGINHGLTSTKVLSVSVMVEYSAGNFVPDGFISNAGYNFNWYLTPTQIVVVNVDNAEGSSTSVRGKSIVVLITYQE
jgi:hypothetical protein